MLLKKQIMLYFFVGLLAIGILIAYADWQVRHFAATHVYNDIDKLPETKVALVLGTVPKLADGRPNLYFQFRIQAAAQLYQHGRVRHIIVSGDNSRREYNEPDAMREALIAHGVPAEVIHADYAGLRTLDSVLRANAIFEQNRYIIVSQRFHNERAVYLARQKGMDVIAYNAQDVSVSSGLKTRIRELGARVKMFWDLWTNTEAKFGGEKIKLPD